MYQAFINGEPALADAVSLPNARIAANMLARDGHTVLVQDVVQGLHVTTYYPTETLVYGRATNWFGNDYSYGYVVEESRYPNARMGTHGLGYFPLASIYELYFEMYLEFNYPMDIRHTSNHVVTLEDMHGGLVHLMPYLCLIPSEPDLVLYRYEDPIVFKSMV